MTRPASSPAILAIFACGTLAALPFGCRSEQVAIGQQDTGGHSSSASTGGATSTGGMGGGSTKTGGTTGAGGSMPNAGGTSASGGNANAGGIASFGGANTTGGVTGAGGSGAGGSTGCAAGWTMCCGQCLSPQAGVCAPCPATGGAVSTGGAPNTGGRGGAGSGGVGAGGSSGSGGNGAGGSSGVVCGGLRGMSCGANEFCDLPIGSCNAADMTGVCVTKTVGCTTIYQPVCGCDGKTYGNDCDRMSAGVTKKSDGACATNDAGVCPAGQMWCPGCPSLGIAGSCGQVCTGAPCAAPDAGTTDAASGSCSAITTQAACDSRSDCHSVFADPGTCGCAAVNCCMHFNRCADGGHANCTGPAACTVAQPACSPPYALGYTASCFEGCVLQTECAGVDAAVTPPACPSTPPVNASSCGNTNMTCFYDNCPSTGRTQAVCTGGTWAVQTAACGTVSCNGPTVLTCPSGQMCLITESGAVSAQCVTNSCGQGPVTPACGTNFGGCSVNASLTSGVTVTCYTCPSGTTCA